MPTQKVFDEVTRAPSTDLDLGTLDTWISDPKQLRINTCCDRVFYHQVLQQGGEYFHPCPRNVPGKRRQEHEMKGGSQFTTRTTGVQEVSRDTYFLRACLHSLPELAEYNPPSLQDVPGVQILGQVEIVLSPRFPPRGVRKAADPTVSPKVVPTLYKPPIKAGHRVQGRRNRVTPERWHIQAISYSE